MEKILLGIIGAITIFLIILGIYKFTPSAFFKNQKVNFPQGAFSLDDQNGFYEITKSENSYNLIYYEDFDLYRYHTVKISKPSINLDPFAHKPVKVAGKFIAREVVVECSRAPCPAETETYLEITSVMERSDITDDTAPLRLPKIIKIERFGAVHTGPGAITYKKWDGTSFYFQSQDYHNLKDIKSATCQIDQKYLDVANSAFGKTFAKAFKIPQIEGKYVEFFAGPLFLLTLKGGQEISIYQSNFGFLGTCEDNYTCFDKDQIKSIKTLKIYPTGSTSILNKVVSGSNAVFFIDRILLESLLDLDKEFTSPNFPCQSTQPKLP